MDKIKLPRLGRGEDYATGDTNDWTYEYTYEDWHDAQHMYPTATVEMEVSKLKESIIQYFYDNPEIAKKNGIELDIGEMPWSLK